MSELRSFNTQHGEVIDLVTAIGTSYKKFGTLILNDANLVENIELSCQHQVECIVHDILFLWLKGVGVSPVTWNTLVTVLDESDLKVLASDIKQQSRSRDEL